MGEERKEERRGEERRGEESCFLQSPCAFSSPSVGLESSALRSMQGRERLFHNV